MSLNDTAAPVPVRRLFEDPSAHLRAIWIAETTERHLRRRAARRGATLTITERSVFRHELVYRAEVRLATGQYTEAFFAVEDLDESLRSLDWAIDNALPATERADVRRIAAFFQVELTPAQQELVVKALHEDWGSQGGLVVHYQLGWRPELSNIDPANNDLPYDRLVISGPLTFTLRLGDETLTRRLEPANETLETELVNLDQNYGLGFRLGWFNVELGEDALIGDATLILLADD